MFEPTRPRLTIDFATAARAIGRFGTLLSAGLVMLGAACETPLLPEDGAFSPAGERGISLNKHGSPIVNRDLAAVRRATARFHRTEAAQVAGYELLPRLDHCFTNQPTGDMGYHYIDAVSILR